MTEPTQQTTAAAASYALVAEESHEVAAPNLPYRPRNPRAYRPGIGLIGAGGITFAHLDAYRRAGYRVVAICDQVLQRAAARRDEFFPEADITTNFNEILAHPQIEVVDIATAPAPRVALIEAAIEAGKHVLSQKPFVLDLDVGERIVSRAQARRVRLAVNHNGRWAPHFAYMREAVRKGLIGDVTGVHVGLHWDHTWTKGTPAEDIDDLVLYDFGIHWFDFMASLVGPKVGSVYATRARAAGQTLRPPLLAQALVSFEGGQGSLVFDADTRYGALDTTYVAGTAGSLSSVGPNLREQRVTLATAEGTAHPVLEGCWFNDGFHGTMAELLCAIEEEREPANSARSSLASLALCFAAVASSHSGVPERVGSVRRLATAMARA
jgi:predicted dehydrogenase